MWLNRNPEEILRTILGGMASTELTSGARTLIPFRRLAAATAFATFALIVVGGIVRVSESGLGCGPAGDVEVDVEVGASGLSFEPQAETNATTVSSTTP